MRSQEVFHSLCAVVSFILSLWTKPDGLCAAPFRSAFWGLANRNYVPIIHSWLDLFSQTHVCNITLGFRPGCFINPYTSCWGPWLVNFVCAGVQVWVVWGPDIIETKPPFLSLRSKYYEPFLPPLEVIQSVRSCFLENQALRFPPPFVPANLPTLFNPSTSSAEQCPSPTPSLMPQPPASSMEPPHPPPNSCQHHGETLAEFLAHLAEEKQSHEHSETSSEAQSRKDQGIAAAQRGYSKSCTVFQLEETQGHYLRVKVDHVEVPGLWHDYPASQRIYHSHINEWDLCPPIPPFSECLTQQDLAEIQQYDDELDAFNNAPTTLKAPPDQFLAQHSGQMDELASLIPSSQPILLQFDVVEHLRD